MELVTEIEEADAVDVIRRVLDDAEGRQWASNREQAMMVLAVAEAVAIARDHPGIYVPHRVGETVPGADAPKFAERGAIFDVAARLHLSEQAVHGYVHVELTLRERLPRLRDLFVAGVAPYLQVRNAVEFSSRLHDANALSRYDELLSNAVQRLAPGAFRTRARLHAERLSKQPLQERHDLAAAGRYVSIEPEPDGMASLHLMLPALDAARIAARLTRTAVHLRNQAAETRTKAQIRADLAAAWLAGDGTPTAARVRPYLLVDGDGRAELPGYGPIDARSAARTLRDSPTLGRLFTDPIEPTSLEVDARRYRPSRAQREWLTLRFGLDEESAEFVSMDAEFDHILDHQFGGDTTISNLVPLRPNLHRLKSITAITFTPNATGGIRVRTPTGFDSDPPPF